uniref:PRONE domain-containing protein n=1 Tax=Kalanchoe fedtschenkoi TaxID=63787 RepID=A0A7N0THK0_KALFE
MGELATRMKLKGSAYIKRSNSESDLSWKSGWGASSRFSSFAASEDGDAGEASSPVSDDISECDMIKEQFARLVLGEDMFGGGNGVSTALAISNGITNLFASIFGKLLKLEPLPAGKKEMWRREMDFFLSVSDHIVEMVPSYKTLPNGTELEIMACRPRSDLFVNLPALRKLESMLLELLDGFNDTDFWYVNQGKIDVDADGSALSNKALGRQNEKMRLPVPRTPTGGLAADSRRQLHLKRESCYQILKAAMMINTETVTDMEVPDSYLESLPKTGRACLGDSFYRFIASDNFSVDSWFDCLDSSDDQVVLELVNRLEAAVNVRHNRSPSNFLRTAKSSLVEAERRELLAGRAEDLLLTVKQKFPNLPQTTLEAAKIQCNKDVGKSILESYSRALGSVAYDIIAQIDDLLSVDKLMRQTTSSRRHPLSVSRSPARTAPVTPACSSVTSLASASKLEILPFLSRLPHQMLL